MNDNQIAATVPWETQNKHALVTSIIEAAIIEYETAATTFAVNVIRDANTREKYAAHVRRISVEVQQEVKNGKITVKEGAEYCHQLRDKLFIEYRKYTSAVGVAEAEKLKLDAKEFDFYLDKYAKRTFKKSFGELSEAENGKIYYAVIESAGRPNAQVSAKTIKLRAWGTGMIVITALLAAMEVIKADDKVKELARQGSILAGGMLGAGLAGLAVSFVCGPAEPLCALVLVAAGGSLGGVAADAANTEYQEELEEFMQWNSR